MIEFTYGEWIKISGRGNICVTKMPRTIDYSLLNQEVKIMGHVYTVIGIETYATNGPTLHKGHDVGLLVRGDVKKMRNYEDRIRNIDTVSKRIKEEENL